MTVQQRLSHARPSFSNVVGKIAVIASAVLLAACATQALPPTAGSPPADAMPIPPVAAPAPQQELPPVSTEEENALRSLIAQQGRLYRVAAPLLINNTDLCKGNVRNLLGFTAKTKYSYSSRFAGAAQMVLGLDERLQIIGVLPGSGAARAGVKQQDILVSVENSPMPQGKDAERQAASVLSPLVNGRTMLKLGLLRGGRDVQANVRLTPACAFGIEVGNSGHVNSYADGRRVLVTRGLLDFTQNDAELAYVVAREMAHNALSHPRRLGMTATVGGIIDNLVRIEPDLTSLSGTSGIKPYNTDLDAAADTLSLYMLARAGYNIDGALAFWQRLSVQYPASVLNSHTILHPSASARWTTIQRTVATIRDKKAERRLLLP